MNMTGICRVGTQSKAIFIIHVFLSKKKRKLSIFSKDIGPNVEYLCITSKIPETFTK